MLVVFDADVCDVGRFRCGNVYDVVMMLVGFDVELCDVGRFRCGNVCCW